MPEYDLFYIIGTWLYGILICLCKESFYFPLLGSFYPFFILTKIQTLSKFEANFHKQLGKKDKFKDKNRIKRIIFLKTREEAKVKTTHNLFPLLFFQIYPSGYTKISSSSCFGKTGKLYGCILTHSLRKTDGLRILPRSP